MNKALLQKSIFYAILAILVEASIRKYVYSSPIVILLKYILLLPLFFFAFRRASLGASTALSAISLPLLATIPSAGFVPYAIYDLISLFYLPVILFSLSLEKRLFDYRNAQKLLVLVSLIGIFNSILIILQSFLGPQHWLSQTVDQSFSVHAFGEALKAPGLAGTSSPYMAIAGLIALDILNGTNPPVRLKNLTPLAQLLIATSVVFNLASRTYALGVVGYIIPRLLIPSVVNKRFDKASLIFLSLPISYLVLQSVASDWGLNIFSANRTVNDFDSVSDRLFSLPLLELLAVNPFGIPLMDGVGLGYSVNSNPLADPFYIPAFCQALGLGLEAEYERFICSFGAIGLLHIIARLFLAGIALRNSLAFLRPRFPACISAGWVFFAFTLANGLLLRANDTAAGTFLVLVTLSASQALMPSYNQDHRLANRALLYSTAIRS